MPHTALIQTVRALERRMTDMESMSTVLRDELEGLTGAFGGMVNADLEKARALESHHRAYAAASQRAALAEKRASRAEAAVTRLELELADLRSHVEKLEQAHPKTEQAV